MILNLIRRPTLIDGALSLSGERRDRAEKMVADLIRLDAYANEPDAIRALVGNGYTTSEIFMLLDDARYLAQQELVGREISEL